jgi:hypothetical protein
MHTVFSKLGLYYRPVVGSKQLLFNGAGKGKRNVHVAIKMALALLLRN